MSRESQFHDRRWALRVVIGAMALTMIPYLFGWSLVGVQPARGWFSWLGYNLDDSCVYLAWMRQAADGHLFQRNLFTTEPQAGHQFSLFFLLLGNIARFTHLPLLFTYHASRILLGIAFLRAVWWLIAMLLEDARARRAAFLLICFSAGLGWLPGLWRHSGIESPVDVWQPEAITFLCLYLSPLFLVSLLLMVGVLGGLLAAERAQSARPALAAGLCGFLLGNIHTYDILTLTAVWGGFLIVRGVVRRRFDAGAWGRALLAGLPTAVSTGYMFYLVKTEEVFARRVAVPTLSPSFSLYALGYGLVLLLALAGIGMIFDSSRSSTNGPDSRLSTLDSRLFLVVWAVVNFAVAYLPVTFQRKMLMGVHLPLSMLAGVALGRIMGRWEGRKGTFGLAAAVLLLSLTNGRFLLRDMSNFQANQGQSRIQRPYLYAGEVAALNWIREHAPPGAPIQPLPWIEPSGERQVAFFDTTVAAFAPGLTGHAVHAGHWGETPDFGETMGLWVRFLNPNTPDDWRRELLRTTGVRYLLFTQKHAECRSPAIEGVLSAFESNPPPGLRRLPEASNADADVYVVNHVDGGRRTEDER